MAGGLDVSEKLAEVFKSHEQHMSDIFKSHQDVLTALAQRLLGGTGPQHTSATQAGMISGAARANPLLWNQAATGQSSATAGIPNSLNMPPAQPAPAQPALGPAPAPGSTASPAGLIVPPGAQPAPNPNPGGQPPANPSRGGGTPAGAPSSNPGGSNGPVLNVHPQGGTGLVSRLWGQAVSRVPALQLGSDFMSEYRSQLNKNAFYRYNGGDSTGGAFDSRFDEEMAHFHSLDNFMTLSDGESRQAFKGATAMGITDNASGQMSRNDFVDAATYAKQSYGAPVGDTLKNEEMLRNMGLSDKSSLRMVIDELSQLSTVATQAGVSVSQARQNWQNLNDQMTTTFGTNAPAMASQVAQAQSMMGSSMQDINLGTQSTDQGYRYMLAGQAGVPLAQLNAMQQNNPVAFDRIQTQMGAGTLKNYVQTEPAAWQRLMQMISTNKQVLTATPNFAMQMATDWWAGNKQLDPNVFLGLAQSFYGTQFPKGYIEATARFIQDLAGQGQGAVDKDTQSGMGQVSASGKTASGQNALVRTSSGQAVAMGSTYLNDLNKGYSANSVFLAQTKAHGGSYEGAMGQLLHKLQNSGEKDPLVQVRANGGEYKVMTLANALRGGFQSQIAAGTARFVGGTFNQKSIKDIVGSIDSSAVKAAQRSIKTTTKYGENAGAYFKTHPGQLASDGKNQWQAGHVTFGLTKQAAQLLQPTQSYADAMGTPKPNWTPQMGDNRQGASAVTLPSGATEIGK